MPAAEANAHDPSVVLAVRQRHYETDDFGNEFVAEAFMRVHVVVQDHVSLLSIMLLCWPTYRFRPKRSSSRTRSCSGPSSIRRIGSDNTVQPHMLTISVPSALSNADHTSVETISSDENAFTKSKKAFASKGHFLRQPRKSTPQGRTLQKIKNWKGNRSGSASSTEDLQRSAGKNFKWILGERRFRGRSFSSSTMLSQPIHDLQMFGSVPPTPTPAEDSHRPKFSLNESAIDFRNKSATLPNSTGMSFASVFEKMTLQRNFEPSTINDQWLTKSSNPSSINSVVDCPCSSCRERRWLGAVDNNYQFPTRSQSDWIAIEKMRKNAGFYYNSHPAVGFENDCPEVPASLKHTLRRTNQHKNRNGPLSSCVYANLNAIQDANEVFKSEALHNKTVCPSERSEPVESNFCCSKMANSGGTAKEFHSLPKNFLKTLYYSRKKTRTMSSSESSRTAETTNIVCPCCGNVFYYNLPNRGHNAKFGLHGMALSEPTTPTGYSSDNSLQEFSRGSRLLSLIPSPRFSSDVIPDYLKPNKSRQTETKDTDSDSLSSPSGKFSNGQLLQGPMSEFHLMHLVPPPQCHSSESALRSHMYENGEYWRVQTQSNGPENQMNYVTYVRSESNGPGQAESSKDEGIGNDQVKDNETSSEGRSPNSGDDKVLGNSNFGVDVTKYEIKKDQLERPASCIPGPNIYLRPRPQDAPASFPYVWLLSSNNETDDGTKCSKFGNANKKPHLGRLPPLKENVAFFS